MAVGHQVDHSGDQDEDLQHFSGLSNKLSKQIILNPGWDNNGKPGNQVATKILPSSKIFGKNPAFIVIYVNSIY